MKSLLNRSLPMGGLIILSFLLGSCQEGKQGPAGSAGTELPSVYASIYCDSGEDSLVAADAEVLIFGLDVVPEVKVNGQSVMQSGGFIWYGSLLPVTIGQDVSLQISYAAPDGSQKQAIAQSQIPGEFHFVTHSPDSTYELTLGQPLTVGWSSSSGGDGYLISFYAEYLYVDSVGNSQYGYTDFDTLVTQNTVTIPAGRLFPDLPQTGSIDDYYGSLGLTVIKGPVQVGQRGNVTGDATGFFYTLRNAGYLSFGENGFAAATPSPHETGENQGDLVTRIRSHLLP